jgi:DNA-directed RNA polymerase specialized sigma24 family protein
MAKSWPDPDQAVALIHRLHAGDPTAPADFADSVLDPLVEYLRAANPAVDDHTRLTAAGDAVLSVIHHPTQFDPTRGDMPRFLRMAARGDLVNLLKREQRHRQRRAGTDSVELLADARNITGMDDESADFPSFDDPDLVAAVATFTDEERRVLDLMRDGERRTVVFAASLGITDRPPDEQTRVVKQVKDRIKVRLRRAVGGS